MPDALDHYRRIRDFAATPEPSGEPAAAGASDGLRFVIQQHSATRLHWDLRLEHDGVLQSFALPRGVPWNPKENRLAVHTEDHPIEYLEFHGEIPAGQYGAGTMTIWDRGTYEIEKREDKTITFVLRGERISGRYALFQIDGKNWMIHRKDPPQDPHRRPLPDDLRPMRATAGSLPTGGWAYEIRWVGERVLLTNDAGTVTIADEHGADISDAFPEVRRLGRALGAIECILDAVLIDVDRDRRPTGDRTRVQDRREETSPTRVRRASEDRPVAATLVDVLWLEGHLTTGLTYEDRRRLLAELDLTGPAWQTPGYHEGDGEALLAAARAQGLPGLIAKRLGSTYRPGVATEDWIAVDG